LVHENSQGLLTVIDSVPIIKAALRKFGERGVKKQGKVGDHAKRNSPSKRRVM